MSDAASRMREARALRDASLALVRADVAHLRNSIASKSLSERFVDRVSEGAVDVFEETIDAVDNHRGALAALIAALFLWLARNPILALIAGEEDDADEPALPDE